MAGMRISPEYLEQNRRLHEESSFYGASGHKAFFIVQELMKEYGCKDVLDYGCGKAGLRHKLGDVIKCYDPAVPEFTKEPEPADLVVCSDVMEHVEPECVEDVISHIQVLTKKVAYFYIALSESRKSLPDGRNTHICIRPIEWWRGELEKYFKIQREELTDRAVRFVCLPITT